MTSREAWEAFYKTGKISDYISYRGGHGVAGGGASVSMTIGENTEHAADNRRSDPAPKADG